MLYNMEVIPLKKAVAVLLVLLLVFVSCVPAAAEDIRTRTTRRIERIMETYEFRIRYDMVGVKYIALQMDNIEQALETMGSSFVKSMVRYYDFKAEGGFRMMITEDKEYDGEAVFSYSDTTLYLYPSEKRVCSTYEIIHQFGRTLFYRIEAIDWYEAAGGLDAYDYPVDSRQFINTRAQANAQEDFAETFSQMILNGGNSSFAADPDSDLYHKCRFMLDTLTELFGSGAKVTQQARAYMGQ